MAFYSVIQKHIKRSLTKLQTRSILSAINATSYLLAKNLNPTLSSVTTNKETVKNSSETDAKVVSYNQNLYMAKLDVESLLTSIRLKETIKNCVNDLISNNFYSGKLTRKNLYPFNVWCLLKGHTYSNKPPAFSCRFV